MPLSNYYDLSVDLAGKSVLVTGGTGSFGKRFVRTVLDRYDPRRLIIFSRDELKQFEMEQAFSRAKHPCLRYFIGDVRDRERLEMAMRDVDYVIHAAALKHVPLAEYNPTECIRTNVLGAENVVQAAFHCGVKKVIALSTDKAANPINLYGASKLASDKIFVAANNLSGQNGTRFAVVRYGNVVGSRGSVIPFFQRLKREGAETLPITDERMTRFWITLQQGVDFVLSCLKIARGGEIFVPKIPSMRVSELAMCLAPGIPTRNVGIRPGEKLHEVMITADDARSTVELKDRFVIHPAFKFWADDQDEEPDIKGSPVPDGFVFSSDCNDDWLDEDGLHKMLKELA
ncbi:MAG: UDP-N-acetylglucosamine 4,6-dehydratase (inverting) [Rhodospirillales bacterium]|nr:UDP-N-acetylglucosamine 4,6-dehydratase (inverting) [Rhodospirillales bacterium]